MLNTIKMLGELAHVIKYENRVSLDWGACACIAGMLGGAEKATLMLDSENHYYGSNTILRIYDKKSLLYSSNKIWAEVIEWGIKEVLSYRYHLEDNNKLSKGVWYLTNDHDTNMRIMRDFITLFVQKSNAESMESKIMDALDEAVSAYIGEELDLKIVKEIYNDNVFFVLNSQD